MSRSTSPCNPSRCGSQTPRSENKSGHCRTFGGVLNSGARLCEPQHIPMQSKPLRVADPRSENKSGHCRTFEQLDGEVAIV